MADKMKKQQEDARIQATKQKEKATTEAKKPAAGTGAQQETRTSARHAPADQAATDDTKEDRAAPKSKKGRPRKAATGGNNISSYFKKADVEAENKPTVHEALEHAADEYEANPTALGEQELSATQQPSLVTGGRMRRYQLEALEWLKSLYSNGLCGILADEMGLGKTVQAISLIAFFKEQGVPGPFLISAPLSTVSNWVDEFAQWTPSIKTVLYHGTKDERATIRRDLMKRQNQGDRDFPVVCTSYEITMNDRKFLAQYQWRYIIVVSSACRLDMYRLTNAFRTKDTV